LSLSSIINIFHPFTLRKELNINEVDELFTSKNDAIKEDLEYDKRVKRNSNFFN
jgi:hypothetical protein